MPSLVRRCKSRILSASSFRLIPGLGVTSPFVLVVLVAPFPLSRVLTIGRLPHASHALAFQFFQIAQLPISIVTNPHRLGQDALDKPSVDSAVRNGIAFP